MKLAVPMLLQIDLRNTQGRWCDTDIHVGTCHATPSNSRCLCAATQRGYRPFRSAISAICWSGRIYASTQFRRESALDAGTSHHRFVPPLDVRKLGEIDLVPRVPPHPTQDGKIGNRRLIREKFLRGQSPVHYAVKSPRFLRIACESVAAVLLVLDRQEMVDLSGDRPESSLLEHQPFENGNACLQIPRPELARLFPEIDEDCTRLEDADGLPVRSVRVDDRRDLSIRTDFQEFRIELLALADIDDRDDVWKRHFLQCHADLAAVGRIESVQLDRHRVSPCILSIECSCARLRTVVRRRLSM